MEDEGEKPATCASFTSAMTITQTGVPYLPDHYVVPLSQRPSPCLRSNPSTTLPIIDLSSLNHPSLRSRIIDSVREACKELGFFQVSFTSLSCIHEDIEEGSQLMAVNCYPACPEPELALGMPPHSDYGLLTILIQSHSGLQIMDHENNWHHVPVTEGALIVQLGDQMEVISNGWFKSVVHRATVNMERNRLSIASIHSLALEKKVAPATERTADVFHALSYSSHCPLTHNFLNNYICPPLKPLLSQLLQKKQGSVNGDRWRCIRLWLCESVRTVELCLL